MAARCLVVSVPTTGQSIPSMRTTACHSSRVSIAVARVSFRGSRSLLAYRAHITGTAAVTMPVLRSRSTRATRADVVASSESKSVLIVNTNSGGHAVIGFWVAQALTKNGHKVTIMTVGKEDSDKMKKPPFSRFAELRDMGVTTVWGEPGDVAAAVGGSQFEVVLDNNGKDLDTVKPVVEWAKANGCAQFLFISSAGIYKNSDQQPLVEGDAVKADAGHVAVEQFLATAVGSGWASFRPQYITGPGSNKDCEEWFFDRIVRDRPVPIPGSGMQMTVIAPVQDMAAMVAAAVDNPAAAAGGIFNCVGDRGVSFDGLVRMCAKAAGSKAEIVHYDPKEAGVDVKKAFPFRNQHFYSEPRAAKEKLGWQPKLNLQDVLNDRFEEYIQSGRHTKDMKFEIDDVILAATAAAVPASVAA